MRYLCVRIYGNSWQNKVYPQIFCNYTKCLEKCEYLQENDASDTERWIPFAVYESDKW